jgi:hypothetical protein
VTKAKSDAYRTRAQQLRAVANDLTDRRSRAVLLAAADDYEAMAVEAERSAAVAAASSDQRADD